MDFVRIYALFIWPLCKALISPYWELRANALNFNFSSKISQHLCHYFLYYSLKLIGSCATGFGRTDLIQCGVIMTELSPLRSLWKQTHLAGYKAILIVIASIKMENYVNWTRMFYISSFWSKRTFHMSTLSLFRDKLCCFFPFNVFLRYLQFS